MVAGINGANSLFDMFAMRMDYLKQRQGVISQNVANADSPGYGARELVPFAQAMKGRNVQPVAVTTTSPTHINIASTKGGTTYGVDATATTYETLPSGNSVVLEEQLMKMAQVNSDYQMVTSLYRNTNSMMKMALGKSTGA